jgi:2-succinyl-5-enolpyruvyl-6-hydroxy-3-cyclohexene-1-carboxylate synthase
LSSLPKNTDLHIGNSSPVRYSNLFEIDSSIEVYCNRGTSGIDGMSSTVVGSAMLTDRINILITGDIAFMYDSNAFWSQELPSQLRVIVINNGGGGIFRIIPGPDQTEELETYFETGHQRNMKSLAQAYDLEYALCKDMKDISLIMASFYQPSKRPKLLEIKTDGLLSAQIQRRYFKKIKESYEQSEKLANA